MSEDHAVRPGGVVAVKFGGPDAVAQAVEIGEGIGHDGVVFGCRTIAPRCLAMRERLDGLGLLPVRCLRVVRRVQ